VWRSGLFRLKLVEFLEVTFRIGLEPGEALVAAEAHRSLGVTGRFVNVGNDLAGLQVLARDNADINRLCARVIIYRYVISQCTAGGAATTKRRGQGRRGSGLSVKWSWAMAG